MAKKAPAITIVPETIGSILQTSQRHLQVPINQRSYSWKEEHVKALYSDLAGAIASNLDEYFLGTIVVVRTDHSAMVFDGQQRLATSLILIAAIRDFFFMSGDNETATLIESESLLSKDRKTHEETPHFRLNSEDRDFFLRRVLRNPNDAERKAAKANQNSESESKLPPK